MRLLLVLAFVLTTMSSSISGMWLFQGNLVGTVMSGATQVLQTLFPYYMAQRALHTAAAKDSIHVDRSPGAVVYSNCTFHETVITGDVGVDTAAQIVAPGPKSHALFQAALAKRSVIQYTLLAIAATSYLYLNYTLYTLADELKSSSSWSFWVPSHALVRQELLQAGCNYYKLDDEIRVTNALLQAIDKELVALESYQNIVYYLDCILIPEQLVMARFRDAAVGFSGHSPTATSNIDAVFAYLTLKKLFFVDDDLVHACSKRRERLLFLKDLFKEE